MLRTGAVKLVRKLRRVMESPAEGGFTLVELMVAVAILGVVVVALASTFVVTARTATVTSQRFDESHDAQIASAYLANDVQSANVISATSCGSGGTLLLSFDYLSGARASYFFDAGAKEVVRRFCEDGSTPSANATLVHEAGSAAPTLACAPGPTCTPGSSPNKVTIRFTEDSSDTGTSAYAFSLSGARRAYADPDEPPGGASSFPPLLALGTTGLQIELTGNSRLKVNGDVVVNSGSQPAVQLTGNNATFVYDGLEIFGTGSCSNCPASPVSTHRSTRLPDPLAGLPAPSTSGLPTNPAPSAGTYFPGVYTTQFVPNGTLSPGVYVLQAGMCISGNQAVTGTGVLIYITGSSSCGGSTKALGISGNGALSLSPQTTGTYANITVWSTTTAALAISGNGAGTSVAGLIYAPTASLVTLSGGNGNLLIGAVIAPNIQLSGGGNSGLVCINYDSAASCTAA